MRFKTVNRLILLFAAVFLDQFVKILIKFNFMDSDKVLFWNFLRFKPVKNVDLSWINSSLNLGIGFLPHILINLIGVIIIFYGYKFYLSRNKETMFTLIFYNFILAGAVCSLIDKMFWGGSLDYIRYTGFLGGYTFDLKDIYITSFEAMIVVVVIINIILDKGYFKSLNSIKMKDITDFILSDIKKLM